MGKGKRRKSYSWDDFKLLLQGLNFTNKIRIHREPLFASCSRLQQAPYFKKGFHYYNRPFRLLLTHIFETGTSTATSQFSDCCTPFLQTSSFTTMPCFKFIKDMHLSTGPTFKIGSHFYNNVPFYQCILFLNRVHLDGEILSLYNRTPLFEKSPTITKVLALKTRSIN